MRNPLLVFFNSLRLSRQYTRLKLPYTLAAIKKCEAKLKSRSGTCPWRGLEANWVFDNREVRTLLNFSLAKQYRLGFDSTLPNLKSIKQLQKLARLNFNITYTSLTKDQIFYNFFYNHGTYNTVTTNSMQLWYKVFKQLFSLTKYLQKTKNKRFNASQLTWQTMWANDNLLWSLLVSDKLAAIETIGYINDTLVEEYDDFFYTLMPWEQLSLSKTISTEYVMDTDNSQYIMPEFFFNQEVALISNLSIDKESSEYVFSAANVVKLLEDNFFLTHPTCEKSVKSFSRSVSYRSLLLYLAVI